MRRKGARLGQIVNWTAPGYAARMAYVRLKRFLKAASAFLIFAALSALLVSCGKASKDKPKIGLALRSFDSPYSATLRRAIETEAIDKAELSIIDGQNQQSAQNLQLDSLFEKGLVSLAIEPVDGNAMDSVISKAKEKRTPIVFFYRLPSKELMRSWDKLFFVGSRESDAGMAQGEILADYWKANPTADRNKDGVLQYVWLGTEGDAGPRGEGFSKALAAAGIKIERIASDHDPAILAKLEGRIEAALCADLASSLGAIEARKAATKLPSKRMMPIIGSSSGELPAAASEALSSGGLAGIVQADAEGQAKAAFALAYALGRWSDPARAGLRITDAKYVWIPYKKLSSSAKK
jgi:methyl-galactoside transport system substrate-binding protein